MMEIFTIDFVIKVIIAFISIALIITGFKMMTKYVLRMVETNGTLAVSAKRTTSLKYALAVVRVVIIFIYIIFLFVLFNIPGNTIVSFFGLVSVAISLLLREVLLDYVFGFLLLLEGKVRIGDTVVVEGFQGTVEIIELRTSKLRDGVSGDVFVVSNRHFTKFIRKKSSRGFTVEVSIPVASYEIIASRIKQHYANTGKIKYVDIIVTKTSVEKMDIQIIIDAQDGTYDNLKQEILKIISEVD